MAKRGRRPTGIPHRSIELWLPEHLLLEVQVYLPKDTLTGKVKHGAWSAHVAQLLRASLEQKAHERTEPELQNAN